MVRNFRKPLIVVGPKLLLRLPVSRTLSLIVYSMYCHESTITHLIRLLSRLLCRLLRRWAQGPIFNQCWEMTLLIVPQ